MKSVLDLGSRSLPPALRAGFGASLFAIVAGCSSAGTQDSAPGPLVAPLGSDTQQAPAAGFHPADDTAGTLSTGLRAADPAPGGGVPTNPCAAVSCLVGTSCEVVDGEARCVPIEPVNPCAAVLCLVGTSCEVVDGEARCVPSDAGGSPPPSAPYCGGIAGIECPGAGTCVDDPSDDCDPERDGADCGGVCECSGVLLLCVPGTLFDDSPDVCACVPEEPEVDACATVRCRAGTHCEVADERARCVPDEQPHPCAVVLCAPGSTCEVVDGEPVCTPPEPAGPRCGGLAGIECPGAGTCVDDPSDDCDPERGGADCGGVCECSGVLALCIEGTLFDESPDVCACVPEEPRPGSGHECRD